MTISATNMPLQFKFDYKFSRAVKKTIEETMFSTICLLHSLYNKLHCSTKVTGSEEFKQVRDRRN